MNTVVQNEVAQHLDRALGSNCQQELRDSLQVFGRRAANRKSDLQTVCKEIDPVLPPRGGLTGPIALGAPESRRYELAPGQTSEWSTSIKVGVLGAVDRVPIGGANAR